MGLFEKPPEVVLSMSHQVFTVLAKVLHLRQWANLVGVHDGYPNLRHFVTIQGIVFSIDTEDGHVLCQLVGNRADPGDFRIAAWLSADCTQTKAMTEDVEIAVLVWIVKKSLELAKRRGMALIGHFE
jgi:hypothetical protein